jgi:hypothetical protein
MYVFSYDGHQIKRLYGEYMLRKQFLDLKSAFVCSTWEKFLRITHANFKFRSKLKRFCLTKKKSFSTMFPFYMLYLGGSSIKTFGTLAVCRFQNQKFPLNSLSIT